MRIKKMLLISSFFLALSLFGCGKKDTTTKKNTTTKIITTEHVHEFGEWQEQSKATCSEEGFRKRKCSCGFYEYEIIPKKEHSFIDGMCSVCGFEQITEGFNIYYSSLDEMYHIDDYTGSNTTVRIPKTYDDNEHGEHKIYIDREIENEVFVCKIKDSNIKKIIIGESFDEIDNYMFTGLNNLEEVVIGSNVKKIGDNAFYNCPKLSNITFNDALEQIGLYSFASCNFKEIKLPYNLKILDSGAFSNNTNLTTFTYYNNLVEIGDDALNNTALESIKISYGITYFGFQAKLPNLNTFIIDARNTKYEFENDYLMDVENKILLKALSPITEIPNTTKIIGPYSLAYLDYSDIDFIVPNYIEYIDFAAFRGSTFKSLTINSLITVIDEMVFADMIIVDDGVLVLPNTITEVIYHAFMNTKCKKVSIPSSVTKLGYSIFEGCQIEEIEIYQTTLDSTECDNYWDFGIDTLYTTITKKEE